MWQHDGCVGIEAAKPLPVIFHCELCRAARADPFWRTTDGTLFPPSRLVPSGGNQQLHGDLVSRLNFFHSSFFRAFSSILDKKAGT